MDPCGLYNETYRMVHGCMEISLIVIGRSQLDNWGGGGSYSYIRVLHNKFLLKSIILHTFRSKCMEYKWYDVSQRVNEPHYATHGRLETIRKRGNSPCCAPHMLEPPA